MKINFCYDKNKDVWCLLNKGKGSNNSPKPTKQYEQFVAMYGADPSFEDATSFVDQYIIKNEIDIRGCIELFQHNWEQVQNEFQNRAEIIFDTILPNDITAYLTINSRCPYNVEDNYFYVSMQSNNVRGIIMHELWHFYTWQGLGVNQEEILGPQKYNDIKEALTGLLNVECRDLLTEDMTDAGYPQHQDLRKQILKYWEKDRNIKNLWNHIIRYPFH